MHGWWYGVSPSQRPPLISSPGWLVGSELLQTLGRDSYPSDFPSVQHPGPKNKQRKVNIITCAKNRVYRSSPRLSSCQALLPLPDFRQYRTSVHSSRTSHEPLWGIASGSWVTWLHVSLHARLPQSVAGMAQISWSTPSSPSQQSGMRLGWVTVVSGLVDKPRCVQAVHFCAPVPSMTLVVDDSALEWGAYLDNPQVQDLWTDYDTSLHIIVLELHAIFRVYQQFIPYSEKHYYL